MKTQYIGETQKRRRGVGGLAIEGVKKEEKVGSWRMTCGKGEVWRNQTKIKKQEW
jgi:hypothetical protein